jgi:uncharacterized protein YkwD
MADPQSAPVAPIKLSTAAFSLLSALVGALIAYFALPYQPAPTGSVPPPVPVVTTPPPVPVPTPQPQPQPVVTPPPAGNDEQGWIWRALVALNARRAQRGLAPVALDQALCRAAAIEAVPLAAGDVQAHWQFPERVRAQGWAEANCGIRNSGFGNVSEGITWGCDTPEYAVTFLDDAASPLEGHRRDFEDPAFTHVGIWMVRGGGLGGYTCVVEWGAQCGAAVPAAPYPGMKIQGPVASGVKFDAKKPAGSPWLNLPK